MQQMRTPEFAHFRFEELPEVVMSLWPCCELISPGIFSSEAFLRNLPQEPMISRPGFPIGWLDCGILLLLKAAGKPGLASIRHTVYGVSLSFDILEESSTPPVGFAR
jgi:hypothetical protein